MRQRIIHKYAIPAERSFTLDLPRGAEVLWAGEQRGGMVLYATIPHPVSDDAPRDSRSAEGRETERRTFLLVPTGEPYEDDGEAEGEPYLTYLATIHLYNSSLTLHLHEVHAIGEGDPDAGPDDGHDADCCH